jgi:hypothetical protein
MNNTLLLISVDYVLIARCLGALLWGILYAVYLNHGRLGPFLAEERTWLSVVIGVGVDLLIGIGALWWEIWLIVALSGIGVIARSLIHERDRRNAPNANGYKVKWGLEDAIAILMDLIQLLESVLEAPEQVDLAKLSRSLRLAHRAHDKVKYARQGEYYGKAR